MERISCQLPDQREEKNYSADCKTLRGNAEPQHQSHIDGRRQPRLHTHTTTRHADGAPVAATRTLPAIQPNPIPPRTPAIAFPTAPLRHSPAPRERAAERGIKGDVPAPTAHRCPATRPCDAPVTHAARGSCRQARWQKEYAMPPKGPRRDRDRDHGRFLFHFLPPWALGAGRYFLFACDLSVIRFNLNIRVVSFLVLYFFPCSIFS